MFPAPAYHTHIRISSGGRIMRTIKLTVSGLLAGGALLWLAMNPGVFQLSGFFPLRAAMAQLTGVLAITCMSVAMVLAVRPRWPERWFGGLDRMYRLHKWLGISALVLAVTHWLWAQGPKWAVGFGLLERPQRGPRPVADGVIEQTLQSLRGTAEGVGEWAFYGAAALMVLALIKWFPYRWFFKTHRILAAAYLALVFHSVVLLTFADWLTPLGLVMAVQLTAGSVAAVIVLLRRVAVTRKVAGTVAAVTGYPGVRTLEMAVTVPQGWPGHRAGQFAFVTTDPAEGPHPYTIASAWPEAQDRLTFIIKELGDHTALLRQTLRPGLPVTVEGPYGCFTFEDDAPEQIWVGGGIGITPFVARLKDLAARSGGSARTVHLFHTTAEQDDAALARLRADAAAAGVTLHVLIDSRDGRLDGATIRARVPGWRQASLWFCGPAGFGQALRADFSACGLPSGRFHQELFALR